MGWSVRNTEERQANDYPEHPVYDVVFTPYKDYALSTPALGQYLSKQTTRKRNKIVGQVSDGLTLIDSVAREMGVDIWDILPLPPAGKGGGGG